MPKTEKQLIGKLGEAIAASFLEQNGYKIIAQNLHFGRNELDIIAEDSDHIIFVEVKTRTTLYPEWGEFGAPSRAVDEGKRKNTVKAARDYLHANYCEKQPRIDVIEVYLSEQNEPTLTPKPIKINHIRNAFDARGRKTH